MKHHASRALWKASGGLAGLIAMLAILIAVNVIVSNIRIRADLTEEDLYSLSEGTRSVLKKLDREVTLKLYFNGSSPQVPVFLKNYARQVEDLLKEYEIAGDGKITLESYDPKPDSDEEEWARRYGISGKSMSMFGPAVYFGLVAVAGEVEGAIPALDPRTESLLEYNVTRLIYRICHPEKPVIGVMSSLPVLGFQAPQFAMPGQPPPQGRPAWIAFQELRKDYEVRDIPTSADEIDPDIDALILVHPKNLSEKAVYALDQFVLRGGRLLAFVDPLCVTDLESQPKQNAFGIGQDTSSDLEKLFKTWGVGFEKDKVLVDQRAVTRIRGAGNRIEESPVLLSFGPDNISRDDVLTTELESVLLPFSGALSDETSDDVKFTVLLRSSESSATVDGVSARFGGQAIRSSLKTKGMALTAAARLTGKFTTAFPYGKPEGEKDGEAEVPEEDIEEGDHVVDGESTIVIVADADMLFDRFCVESLNFFGTVAHQPLNDNLNFLANAVEQVAGSSDLIGIRSRGRFARPFDRVVALEERARSIWQSKEDELSKRLQGTEQKLRDLQGQKDTSQRFILSEEQQRAIANFRKEEFQIKRELKGVRKSLRKDIERLGITVKVVNIALMPLIVSMAGVSYGVYRKRKR